MIYEVFVQGFFWILNLYSIEFQKNPLRTILDTLLISFALYILFQKSYRVEKKEKLTKKEEEELIEEWQPEPLEKQFEETFEEMTMEISQEKNILKTGEFEAKDFATNNFFGFTRNERIIDVCEKTINKYGVGSCGPRGFYGTIDVHLNLEKELSNFLGTRDTIVYSLGYTVSPSVILAFIKKDDLVISDEESNFSIQTGMNITKCKYNHFKHNDMKHLEELLISITEKDKKKKITQKRILVVEGIYQKTGKMCPLDKIVELKNKYKFRLLLDDSLGFGILGKNGKGIHEHFGIDISEIDFYVGSLEYAFGSIGGFCTSTEDFIVEHQRLSGKGYCFSASSPPYLSVGASEALKILQENSKEYFTKLKTNIKLMIEQFQNFSKDFKELNFNSNPNVPIFHIEFNKQVVDLKKKEKEEVFDKIVKNCFEIDGIGIVRAKFSDAEDFISEPSLRFTVSIDHSAEDITNAVNSIRKNVLNIFKKK
eukprot:gene9603-1805_t